MSTFATYVGVADCHGIESFHRKEDVNDMERSFSILRADANRQRHAIYYEASMDEKGAEVVSEFLENKDYEAALTCLKSVAIEFSCMPEHADSLQLIPNPELDPYA
jgi:hypothetical protein